MELCAEGAKSAGEFLNMAHWDLRDTPLAFVATILNLSDSYCVGSRIERRKPRFNFGLKGKIPLLGAMFKNTNRIRQKQELVILLKPTLIRQQSDWTDGARDVGARLLSFDPPPARK